MGTRHDAETAALFAELDQLIENLEKGVVKIQGLNLDLARIDRKLGYGSSLMQPEYQEIEWENMRYE